MKCIFTGLLFSVFALSASAQSPWAKDSSVNLRFSWQWAFDYVMAGDDFPRIGLGHRSGQEYVAIDQVDSALYWITKTPEDSVANFIGWLQPSWKAGDTLHISLQKSNWLCTLEINRKKLPSFPFIEPVKGNVGIIGPAGAPVGLTNNFFSIAEEKESYVEEIFLLSTEGDTVLYKDEPRFYRVGRQHGEFFMQNEYRGGKTYYYDFSDLADKRFRVEMSFRVTKTRTLGSSGIYFLTTSGREFNFLFSEGGESGFFTGQSGMLETIIPPKILTCADSLSGDYNSHQLSLEWDKFSLKLSSDNCPMDLYKIPDKSQPYKIGLADYGQHIFVKQFRVYLIHEK